MTHTTQFTTAVSSPSSLGVTAQSHLDYLRLSQNARAAAVAASQTASSAFWAAIARSVTGTLRSLAGYHASVRLGGGHQVSRARA